ncbi:9222_t:CDS:2, partial [Racocetra persica]
YCDALSMGELLDDTRSCRSWESYFEIFAKVKSDVGSGGFINVDFFERSIFLSQSFPLNSNVKANDAVSASVTMPVKLTSLPRLYNIIITITKSDKQTIAACGSGVVTSR